jgi:hypothetical protein
MVYFGGWSDSRTSTPCPIIRYHLNSAELHRVLSNAVFNAKISSRLPNLTSNSILVPEHPLRIPVILEGKKSRVVLTIECALPVRFGWVGLACICTHVGSQVANSLYSFIAEAGGDRLFLGLVQGIP